MGIEHRWSARKDININVSLYYPPVGVINGRTRNISLEGMFVELSGIKIPRQARLEVLFHTGSAGNTTEHRLPACVVHEHNGGIGLMLNHTGYREIDALRYMLNVA